MTMRARDTASDDAIAEQAARWVVALTADDAAAREKARIGFERWRQADRRHAEAAARMEHLVEQMQRMRADGTTRPARAALNAAFADGGRARRMGAALALVLALGLPGWLAVQAYPPSYLMAALTADARTGTGEWATRTLADDTRLTLGSGSAVDLRFDEGRRTLELLWGEILVDVAPDAARPFVVETPHGRMRALGTRFAVVREADATVLTVLESKVAVEPPSSPAGPVIQGGPIVQAGQRVRLTAAGPGPVTAVDVRSVEGAWRFRQLVVQGEPLPDVLDRLNRHRRGLIRYDRAALEAIKVSAVLPLDDTDRALSLLAASFPAIRVRTLTPWLVLVDAPGGP